MSLSRFALVAFAALITTFSVNSSTIAADSSASAAPIAPLAAAARPAPCCGTIVGDD